MSVKPPSILKKSTLWETDEQYFGGYKVTRAGVIYGLKGIKLTPQRDKNGYMKLSLNILGKRKMHLVHRVIAMVFIPNIFLYKEVNHIDGNKTNNNSSNLEWCTRSYNCKHKFDVIGYRLSDKQREACSNNGFRNQHLATNALKKKVGVYLEGTLIESYESGRDASRKLGYNETYISKLCMEKRIINGRQFLYL